jgi:hypothetical protein
VIADAGVDGDEREEYRAEYRRRHHAFTHAEFQIHMDPLPSRVRIF